MKRILVLVVGIVPVLFLHATHTDAFSLLGPFAPWMTTTNGFGPPNPGYGNLDGDIGGPMNMGEGYRWNVPAVTYGFDASFLDYFGSNGVAAVEDAVKILNDLPPASAIVLSNYPTQSELVNYIAGAKNLYDLKSMALALLLEQMGLAQPTRFIYVVRQIDPAFMYLNSPFLNSNLWPPGTVPNQILLRNFDPASLDPSTFVNSQLYGGFLYISGLPDQTPDYVIPLSIPVNPLINRFAVADWLWSARAGYFFNGLTRDDVGGLRYLFSPENINCETLLRSVHPAREGWYEHRGHDFVRGAWRPGIDKITFISQPMNPGDGRFLPTSYRFKDVYIKNNVMRCQELERRVIRPDILFCAADTGADKPYTPFVVRTGTTNWLDNAVLNGSANSEGPGVIQGPIKIIFHKLGPAVESEWWGTFLNNAGWASFDGSTNLPITYPVAGNSVQTGFTIRLRFFDTDVTPATQLTNVTWHLPVSVGGQAFLEVSTNQTDWSSVATVTNVGSVTEWYYEGSDNPPKYFRAIPHKYSHCRFRKNVWCREPTSVRTNIPVVTPCRLNQPSFTSRT